VAKQVAEGGNISQILIQSAEHTATGVPWRDSSSIAQPRTRGAKRHPVTLFFLFDQANILVKLVYASRIL
jgi:hypothetical protein